MVGIQEFILYCSLFIALFFEVFLLITYFEVRSEIEEENEMVKKDLKYFPTVSIIVPCFNEEKTVEATIKSLFNLDYPRELLSILLVNDGSTDGTLKALKQFDGHPQVRIIDKVNGGKHTAVNLALESVNTDLVGCLDADSFVSPDALKKIAHYFEDLTVMAVTPSIKVHNPNNVIQHIQKTEYSWSIFLRRMLSSLGALYVTPGPFSIFRTKVFRDLGSYKYAYMTEDMEMALRMQKNHYRIVNAHSAHVYTVTPRTLPSLVKQRTRWTYGFINNVMDYKALFFNRKYGNIGMFVLPIALFSIFSTLYIISNILWKTGNTVFDLVVRYQAVGFNWNPSFPSFDWYFMNTGFITMLSMTAVGMTMFILYLSFKLAEGKFRFNRGIVYYLFLYTFMVPLWLVKALFDTLLKREVSWR